MIRTYDRRSLWRHAAALAAIAPAIVPFAAAAGVEDDPSYLRVVEDDSDRVALEIATREFVRAEGEGPRVALVGVAHIGDKQFYQKLQGVLGGYDVVLYESVLPPGARSAAGDTAAERAASTEASLRFVAGLVETYRERRQDYPEDLDELARYLERADARLAHWLEAVTTDGWGRRVRYQVDEAPGGPSFSLTSFGKDGRPGGDGADRDLIVRSGPDVEALPLGSNDNLQAELARTLGLEFQLEEINYQNPGWRCSDMAMDEVDRALKARGVQFDVLGDTLIGSSLPAMVIKLLMRVIRFADMFFDGAIADMGKIMIIETLGDETLMEQAMSQFGDAFTEVIVEMRNQVAIDDLKRLVDREPEVGSVAIFYGAAHMPDLERRLVEQLGYVPRLVPVEDGEPEPDVRWLKAIEVDMRQSAVPAAELREMRRMARQMMEMQRRR